MSKTNYPLLQRRCQSNQFVTESYSFGSFFLFPIPEKLCRTHKAFGYHTLGLWNISRRMEGKYLDDLLEEIQGVVGGACYKKEEQKEVLGRIFYAIAWCRREQVGRTERCGVAISKKKELYAKIRCTNKTHVGMGPTLRVVQGLEKLGLIKVMTSHVPGICSILFPTPAFPFNKPLLVAGCGAGKCIAKLEKEEVTIPMNKKVQALAIEHTLARINAEISSHTYRISGEDADLPTHMFLYRTIFNSPTLDRGGRNYSDFQCLSKTLRPKLLIDGKPVVELDYSAFHIRMLYHQLGLDYTRDPYLIPIPEWDCYQPSDALKREVIKKLWVYLPNIGSLQKAYALAEATCDPLGISDEPTGDGPPPICALPERSICRAIIDRIIEHHRPIARFLFNDVGVKLQAIDGQLARDIMLSFAKRGRPCLGVHDSFVVWAQDGPTLQMTMIEEYQKLYPGKVPVIH